MARVYLAGPISGLSYQEARNGWRMDFAASLHPSIEPLSPMRQEGHLAEIKEITGHAYDYNQLSTAKGIFAKDKLDVRRSDAVVFNFWGAKKFSIGSVFEMGWADAYQKPIVLIMEPDRGANIHDHLFVTEAAQFRCHTVKEAAEIINAILMPGI